MKVCTEGTFFIVSYLLDYNSLDYNMCIETYKCSFEYILDSNHSNALFVINYPKVRIRTHSKDIFFLYFSIQKTFNIRSNLMAHLLKF